MFSISDFILFKCLLQLLNFKVHPLDFGFAGLLKDMVFVNNLSLDLIELVCFLSEGISLNLQLADIVF